MGEKGAAQSAEARIARLAARQHGVIATRQLYALGLSKDWIGGRSRRGWLHPLHRGAYAVGHPNLTRHGAWIAAVLACGEDAVLSHRSAGALWDLLPPGREDAIEVTVATPVRRRQREGIIVHRSAALDRVDATRREGVPVTAVPRTLLDLATVLRPRGLERAIDGAERLRLCDPAALREAADRHPHRAGTGAVRAILDRHSIGSTVTRSELEERFLALCRERELGSPLVNAPLLGLTVDFHWPQEGVVVEVDGHASHGTRRAFQDDRDRDTLLAAHGVRTLRFTWWDVARRPAVVAHRLGRVLASADRRR